MKVVRFVVLGDEPGKAFRSDVIVDAELSAERRQGSYPWNTAFSG